MNWINIIITILIILLLVSMLAVILFRRNCKNKDKFKYNYLSGVSGEECDTRGPLLELPQQSFVYNYNICT